MRIAGGTATSAAGFTCTLVESIQVATTFVRRHARVTELADLLQGYIIGTVELYDVLLPMNPPLSNSPWASANQWNWLWRDPRPLKRPIPARGSLNWWKYGRAEATGRQVGIQRGSSG